jgi:thiamine-phosphate pyrophosphorylase
VAAAAGWAALDLARAFLSGGATWLQIRAKHLGGGALLDLCEQVRDLAAHRAAVIVNDRVDVAVVARIGAVHLGQEDLPVEAARRLLGPDAIIGFSTHTPQQIEAAALLAIDYVAVGPVFGTETKNTGYASVGLDRVRYAAYVERGLRPIVAIGGITLDRARDVIEAGATSVAVISDLLAGDPEACVRAFLDRLA